MTVSPESLEFTLAREGEWWVATHIETDVASHGSDPNEAVAMATEALELTREDPDPVSDEEHRAFLHDLGIEPHDGDPIDSPDGMP
jgi:predicted RNase H-like HicB family nuclease